MYLIYLDESGNTGNNLADPQQPVFLLCALAIPEARWLAVEQDLHAEIQKLHPSPPEEFEIHGTELMSGRGWCREIPLADRILFRDAWLSVAAKHELRIVFRAISKRRFQRWIHRTFGPGIAINPHVAAFPLVARVVDDWLQSLPGSQLRIFVSDENKEIVRDVEKAIKVFRATEGILRLGQIIEKGFFIDSSKSVVLQLCDVCALTLRKKAEAEAGFRDHSLYHSGIALLEPLLHRGDEALQDVLEWLTAEQKKKRPGTKS